MINEIINRLIVEGDWDAIISIAQRELKKSPESHWYLTMLASAYYEKKEYATAYETIAKAIALQEDCPLALWHLGNILKGLGKPEDAIIVWQELISRDEARIAYDECGEGLDWARSLINDCRYMISKAYGEIGDEELANDFKRIYLKNIKEGVNSIYNPMTL